MGAGEPRCPNYRFFVMRLARQLERKLEDAVDGLAGRIFRRGLAIPELAARLAREAELSEFRSAAGPATANHFRLLLNPVNLAGDTENVEVDLARTLSDHAADRGWRLEGPVEVHIEASPVVGPGSISCETAVVPGPLQPWGQLTGAGGHLDIRHNRAILGRAPESDLVVNAPEVSRRHALVYRHDGEVYVRDLESANGTMVDGRAVRRTPAHLQQGSMLTVAGLEFRFTLSP